MAGPVSHTALDVIDHLPVLQVLLPFLAAPLCVLIGHRVIAWGLAFAASLGAFAIAALLLLATYSGGTVSYEIGGWAPPLGIEYRVDAANALILLLVSGISTLVIAYAPASIAFEIPKKQHTLFYTCYLLCFSGLLGVVVTGDAFNVFVFLEISSLSTYVLVSQGAFRDQRALTAAYDYLIMGTIGATFFVIGIGFLYMATGTLNMADMADMAQRIPPLEDNRTVFVGFAFIVVGISLKLAMYPLHLWLPNAYTFAPSVVTAFLAATATKVALYVMLRFMFTVFGTDFISGSLIHDTILLPLALLAMFAASFVAIFQSDFKKMLAYSSLAQIGYMLLGITFLSQTGLSATLVHMVNHGMTKAVLFMGLGALVLRAGGSFYDRLQGLGKQMPWTSAAIVIGGLSLIGVPGTAGFVSKWVLVEAAMERGWWIVAILVVLSSLFAVIYVWRVFEVLYLSKRMSATEVVEAPLSMLIPLWVMALACVYFGLATDVTLDAARTAALGLLSGGR